MPAIDWQRVLPVLISILIIIAIALLRNTSRTLASIIAVMPINVPLGLWVVYSGVNGEQEAMVDFSQGLIINIIPTLLFMGAVWLGFKAGWSLIQVIGVGYLVWAVSLGGVFLVRAALRI